MARAFPPRTGCCGDTVVLTVTGSGEIGYIFRGIGNPEGAVTANGPALWFEMSGPAIYAFQGVFGSNIGWSPLQ